MHLSIGLANFKGVRHKKQLTEAPTLQLLSDFLQNSNICLSWT